MPDDAGRTPLAPHAPAAPRIVQVIGTLDIAAAGPTYSVTRLSEALASRGAAVQLMAAGRSRRNDNGRVRTLVYERDLAGVPGFRSLYISRGLDQALAQAAAGAVLHVHGLWSMPTVYPARHARRHGAPLVQSPRGMLAPAALRFSQLSKSVFSAVAQRPALAAVTCFHATSPEEMQDVRAFGLRAPVAIIPNGIDMPQPVSGKAAPESGARTLLYLGRVHPKKAIENLLEAWARLEPAQPDWRLRIVGPPEGDYGRKLRALASSLRLARVVFEDGLFGDQKDAAYRDADVLVLPTLNENFGLVVAEALANGTPVISTKGTPWQGLVEHRCGWWIDHGVAPLEAALREVIAMPREALGAMGLRGRDWMARDYSWERVASDMLDVYRWCLQQQDRPACVRVEL